MGSIGQNCIGGGLLTAVNVLRYRVSAQSNWWGQPNGPTPRQTLVTLGSLDTAHALDEAPDACD